MEEETVQNFVRYLKEFGDELSSGNSIDKMVLYHHRSNNTEYFRKLGFEVLSL